ncbi:hypothetical protein [Parvicella tangerina]|uniref:Uncharacterized protein n=1 Tax=Parvicella tangerina TaxID=2829795 RepID=A0A916NRM8_9FLAO|nr:hypothetical protein [Parvicella tangerina]CAG5081575.1 hypothetical protein CRYO30217_01673 [Parvicella tangerina]
MEDVLDFKENEERGFSYKYRYTAVIIISIPLVAGIVFEFLHLPGRAILTLIFGSTLAIYNIYSFFHLKGQNMLNNILFGLSMIATIYILWGAFFNHGHPYNFKGLYLIGGYSIISCTLLHIAHLIRKKLFFSKQKNNH